MQTYIKSLKAIFLLKLLNFSIFLMQTCELNPKGYCYINIVVTLKL